jgi:hypothetical protein
MRDAVELRRQVAQAAQDYLDGKVGAVETARLVTSLAHRLDASLSELLIGFAGIDSETDAFPIGKVRKMWNPDALRREDDQRQRYEESVAGAMHEMCKKVVALFGPAPPNSALQRAGRP